MKNPGMVVKGIFVSFMLLAMVRAPAQKEIPLWPNGTPGSEGKTTPEKIRVTEAGEHVVSNINSPSITPFLPIASKATGVAVIIAPGGGHRELWIEHEGYNPAKWLSDHGIAAFVLKYRLSKEENSTYTVDEHSVMDMLRAVRLIRSRSKEWKIDTSRIGVMGFSAGGEVAALSAMRFDQGNEKATDMVERLSSHPGFQALIYPGNSSRFRPTKYSPPLFIVCGYQDRPDISKGMAEVYLKYKDAGVPAELHIYSNVGHGFGLREGVNGAVTGWPMRLQEWLSEMGFLKAP